MKLKIVLFLLEYFKIERLSDRALLVPRDDYAFRIVLYIN